MIKWKFAEAIKRLGKNASDIARETGLNRNTVNALLHGQIEGIKFETLEKICSLYHIKISDLIEHTPTASDTFLPIKRHLYKQAAECFPFTFMPWFLVAGWYKLEEGGKEYSYGDHVDLYAHNDYGSVYWEYEALRNLALAFYRKYGEYNRYQSIYKRYVVYALELETLYMELQAKPLESKEAVQDFFARLRSAYDGFWEHSLFIDAFDTGVDHEKIMEIAKAYHFEQKDIEILTTPWQMTFFDEQKLAFLELMKQLSPSDSLSDKAAMAAFLKKNGRRIEEYRKAFDYYQSTYAKIRHISLDDIALEIENFISNRTKHKEEHRRLLSYQADKRKNIEATLKKHRLKENPLVFFSDLTYWREHRKKYNLMGIHCLAGVLDGLERLTGISWKSLAYLSYDEVDNVLKGLLSEKVLSQRRQRGILLSLEKGDFRLFEDKEAESIRDNLEAILHEAADESDIIRGQVASQGYARGTARIIMNEAEFDTFNEGEVLVTSMTRPEFVPLMKRAAAIVTNEGGITCHAAIVSRELRKPCIIGTKNATKLIKNGDLVEVRANHGTIRIVRS